MRFPGYGPEAARFLMVDRGAVALGIDTLSVDPGQSTDFPVHQLASAQEVYLMQNPLNLRASEVIATYVYKVGLLQADFSFSTAVGLFNAVINMCLLLMVNRIARRLGETSLW